jgi:hypothetical protein
MTVRQCGACHDPVVQAFTDAGTALLLDYPPEPKGAVAAHIDGPTGVWRARFLTQDEEIPDPDAEVRFRQHSVTCSGRDTDSRPLILPDLDPPEETDAPRTAPIPVVSPSTSN